MERFDFVEFCERKYSAGMCLGPLASEISLRYKFCPIVASQRAGVLSRDVAVKCYIWEYSECSMGRTDFQVCDVAGG